MVPVVLITFILFLAYYAYRRKQIDKVNTQKESDFWQRENDANSKELRYQPEFFV